MNGNPGGIRLSALASFTQPEPVVGRHSAAKKMGQSGGPVMWFDPIATPCRRLPIRSCRNLVSRLSGAGSAPCRADYFMARTRANC